MKTFLFSCPKHNCYLNPTATVEEVGLLRTVVTAPNDSVIEWVIATCPKCKETFLVRKGTEMFDLAPKTHIASPKMEGPK